MKNIRLATAVASMLALGSSVAIAETASPAPGCSPAVKAMHPAYAELEVKPGNRRTIGELKFFVPLMQDIDRMLFIDVRGMRDSKRNTEGNLGLGYRQIINNKVILGAYIFGDVRRTRLKNTFYAVTLGVEALMEKFEGRVNVYIPNSKKHVLKRKLTPGSVSTKTGLIASENQRFERMLYGFDAEVGAQIPTSGMKNTDFRVYVGGYHFDRSGAQAITGPKGRVELRFNDVVTPGSRLTLGAEILHDKRNTKYSEAPQTRKGRTHFYGQIALKIPLQFGKRTAMPQGLQRRLAEFVIRDVDIPGGPDPITDISTNPELVAEIDSGDGKTVNTYYADGTNGDDAKDGKSAENAQKTLKSIVAATKGDDKSIILTTGDFAAETITTQNADNAADLTVSSGDIAVKRKIRFLKSGKYEVVSGGNTVEFFGTVKAGEVSTGTLTVRNAIAANAATHTLGATSVVTSGDQTALDFKGNIKGASAAAGDGIVIQPSTIDSTVMFEGTIKGDAGKATVGHGIHIKPSGTGTATVNVNNATISEMQLAGKKGIQIATSGAVTTNVNIDNSTIDQNAGGVDVTPAAVGGTTNLTFAKGSKITKSVTTGLRIASAATDTITVDTTNLDITESGTHGFENAVSGGTLVLKGDTVKIDGSARTVAGNAFDITFQPAVAAGATVDVQFKNSKFSNTKTTGGGGTGHGLNIQGDTVGVITGSMTDCDFNNNILSGIDLDANTAANFATTGNPFTITGGNILDNTGDGIRISEAGGETKALFTKIENVTITTKGTASDGISIIMGSDAGGITQDISIDGCTITGPSKTAVDSSGVLFQTASGNAAGSNINIKSFTNNAISGFFDGVHVSMDADTAVTHEVITFGNGTAAANNFTGNSIGNCTNGLHYDNNGGATLHYPLIADNLASAAPATATGFTSADLDAGEASASAQFLSTNITKIRFTP